MSSDDAVLSPLPGTDLFPAHFRVSGPSRSGPETLGTMIGPAGRRIARESQIPSRVPYPHLEFLFVLSVFLVALFVRQLGTVGPLLHCMATGLFILGRPEHLLSLKRCLPILFLPIFALISVLWSQAPSQTLYYGTQYLLTVFIACQIGAWVPERQLLLGLFFAFLAFGCANMKTGLDEGLVTFGGFYDHPAFTGLMAGKNTQADISALGLMIALTVFVDSLRNRSAILGLASMVLFAIAIVLVGNAQSTGAIVASLVGGGIILTCSTFRVLPIRLRFTIYAVTWLLGLTALLTQGIWYEALLETILEASGKDATFTGRTYIWERARVAIDQAPLLGMGFAGYWNEGNLEAEAIWRALEIPGKAGFNFHNSYYEIRVHLGLVGVVLFLAVLLPLLVRSTVQMVRMPSAMTVLFGALWLYEISRMNFESIGLGLFHYTTFLFFAGLAWATRPFKTELGPVLRKPVTRRMRARLTAP